MTLIKAIAVVGDVVVVEVVIVGVVVVEVAFVVVVVHVIAEALSIAAVHIVLYMLLTNIYLVAKGDTVELQWVVVVVV